MDDILNLFKAISSSNKKEQADTPHIPKEVIEQYPYGQFPLKYTKSGQEIIRKQSEDRFAYKESEHIVNEEKKDNNMDLNTLLPIIQMLSGGKKNSKDLFKILAKILFKDNPEMEKIMSLMPNLKAQEFKQQQEFPDTNKVKISSLKKID